jgi:hypothetical protein
MLLENAIIKLEIPLSDINLSLLTKEGLNSLMECALEEEDYEGCILIKTEILRRMEVPIYLPITQ